MTYEKVKSVILTILIVFSLVLTWNLWTYQPKIEKLENASTVQEVSLSPKKEIKEIVKPDKIIFHSNNRHYETITEQKVNDYVNEISTWDLDRLERISSEQLNIAHYIETEEVMEIIFPDSIPMSLYKNYLSINDEEIPNFSFDRILIHLEETQKENNTIYFASQETKQLYKGLVPFTFINGFKDKYFEEIKSYTSVFPYTTGSEQVIYLPENKIEVMSYQYLSKPIDSDILKDALFNDPSLVQKNYFVSGEEYTDGQNLMRENTDTNTISYIDPSEVGTKSDNKLIRKSIDFVNIHGGWTDNYRFVNLDDEQKSVLFRLYGPDGYPVFSENNTISELRIVWGKTDISRYMRNNFSLGLLTSTSSKNLESGYTALQNIQKSEGFNPRLLKNVKIGYEMDLNAQSLLIQLEPSWYYLYNGSWQKWTPNELGGEKIGLE